MGKISHLSRTRMLYAQPASQHRLLLQGEFALMLGPSTPGDVLEA